MTYIPDEDSFLIKKHAESLCKNKKCLDMGTGSGIIAKAMKDSGAKSILAVDIEPQNIKEVPFAMRTSMIILAIGCIVAGVLLIPIFKPFLESAVNVLLSGNGYKDVVFGAIK